ncbi:MAG TPA: Minf_1886 family protein [Longimicrobiaceae bacterium]|nr:Minf_1886 family protein [Longimicrobiaceae bacterium]
MSGILLADAVMDRLRRRYPGYHETAYLFILSALHFTIERLHETRHISGRELAEGCRDLALQRWGLMARSVLQYWGIRSTSDLGAIVFALVECGVLVKQDDDSLTDFEGVYDFTEAFDAHYPWPGVRSDRT